MDRRTFLRHAARWSLALPGLGAIATACTSNGSPSPSKAPGSPSVGTSSTPPSGSTGGPPWARLVEQVDGPVVRPGGAAYRHARLDYDPRFDDIRPAAIVFVESEQDVARTIAFAGDHDIAFAVRCGGHSYGGYSLSDGIVLDVSRLSMVRAEAGGLATVGAGARLIDVVSGLSPSAVMVPGGTCASVGISGLTMGGGQGVTARLLGLTCDSLEAATVVTADGRTLRCDADQHADLFWALRGGGGGNFGVVTSLTFRTHVVPELTLVALRWPWANADAVLDAWQAWGPSAPLELWSSCRLRWEPGAGPTVSVEAVWTGSPSSNLGTRLVGLSGMVGASPSRSLATMSYRDAAFFLAGCSGYTTQECRLTTLSAEGRLHREAALARSDFFDDPIRPRDARRLLGAIAARGDSAALASQEGGIVLDAWGGRIAEVADDATALPHRQARFLAQEFVTFRTKLSASTVTANRRWLNEVWHGLRPSASGFAYVNYIDPELPDWLEAYYGANLPRLVDVKRAYDPHDVFRSARGIPTSVPG
jgi:FAD binding domain-containing protein/berberine-like enzyme